LSKDFLPVTSVGEGWVGLRNTAMIQKLADKERNSFDLLKVKFSKSTSWGI